MKEKINFVNIKNMSYDELKTIVENHNLNNKMIKSAIKI